MAVLRSAAAEHLGLDRAFANPPASARPWVYWFWLNGNITSNGITADLEAMQQAGIGGVLIMEVDQGAPKGPMGFGGPAWRGLFRHVCNEAHRLGLEVNMNNDAGWCGSGGPWITPNLAMQKVVWSETNITGPCLYPGSLLQPQVIDHYYRDIAVLAFPTPLGNARIADIEGKSALVPKHIPVSRVFRAVPANEIIARNTIVNLTPNFDANGEGAWNVPAGRWTILRFGHTPTGVKNHPAPEAGLGLESDKLSKIATQAMFDGLMGKLIADNKPLAGKTLVSTHIDSWETGSQNWTPSFREDFQKLRHYDPLPFLPVMTGRVVESPEVSERFLWDIRQTVSELLVKNYAGEFRRLANQHGLRLSIEAYDGNPCDDLSYGGQADEPMAEFWSAGPITAYSCLEMSSVAHTYGRRILGAESFTASDIEKWQLYPAAIKSLGDWALCEGINRFVFHRYAMQPWQDRAPGMSMGPWGLHYERTQTWWPESASWHQYLARCQYLLRQGLFVADICFMEPEGSPMRFTPTMPWRTGNTPDRPRYDFDGCSPEVVLTRMKVHDGKLVLPDGMSYRVLVLPQVETMTPLLLEKIRSLIQAGATVIGPPPRQSPSLTDYPQCDGQVTSLTEKMWAPNAVHRVIWSDAFETLQPSPSAGSPLERAKWIWHREGNPAVAAPVGERDFRRVLDLSDRPQIASARLFVTVDNSFQVRINGTEAGAGGDHTRVFAFDIKRLLKQGKNIIAIAGVNGGDQPNPAGLIAALDIHFDDGSSLEVDSDGQWESSLKPSAGWRRGMPASEDWRPAMELGAFGMQPWGSVAESSATPYVFPDFQAIAGVLQRMGIPPDFEGDSRLRFIHRRDKSTDIYFIANGQANWLQANCGFRVSGKTPEIWDPLTGEMSGAAFYQETNGQTFVQLTFEPTGSRFVIFRRKHQNSTPAFVALKRDGENILPERGKGIASAPCATVDSSPHGFDALIWQPGKYEFEADSGPAQVLDVASVSAPLAINGPWEVYFQPGRGAPEHLTFDTLVDWAQHTNAGVKYFSGSAIYKTWFDISPQWFERGERAFLDLGNVAVVARVTLNNKDLGVLWKAPFLLDVTQTLKPGENALEIKVANLWVNRMIGDEQLSEDSDRNPNGTLKEWPVWLEDGQPSPTGRFTFTSWRLWHKDSPLQPSGLLGPVKIVPAKKVRLTSNKETK